MTHPGPFPCGADSWLSRSWLTHALCSHNPDTVIWVLSKKPRANDDDQDGSTALIWALQTEADLPHLEPTGETGALTAERAAELTIRLVDLLLGAGADSNLRDRFGGTALHAAAAWSSPRVVQHLLAHGADPFAWQGHQLPLQPADVAKHGKRWEVAALLRGAMGQTPAGRPLPTGAGNL